MLSRFRFGRRCGFSKVVSRSRWLSAKKDKNVQRDWLTDVLSSMIDTLDENLSRGTSISRSELSLRYENMFS